MLITALLLLSPLHICLGSTNNNANAINFDEIDKLHHEFSSLVHTVMLQDKKRSAFIVKTPKALHALVSNLLKENKPIEAANLVIKHIPMLEKNYDNLVIFEFIDILLKQNELGGANKLYTILRNEGDRTLYSNATFYFVKYYFERNKWEKVLELLQDTINDLAPNEYNHALLMKGISLQHKLLHRKAIKVYNQVSPSSAVYIPARLNMATADIRQGWWTDGHTIINDVLSKKLPAKNEESINRLYLTLGYSFLYKEYYRNSREAFRNVGLKSRYTNRAILGLALTAANQEDYIGALNAVRLLKEGAAQDLATDESYLLMPYFYEKLQQHTTASAGYTEAIAYYNGRITKINEIINSEKQIYKHAIVIKDKSTVRIDKTIVDFSDSYPEFIIKNYQLLDLYVAILNSSNNKLLQEKYEILQSKYTDILQQMIKNKLKTKVRHLNSYKDQARYGLARLYDNNLASSN